MGCHHPFNRWVRYFGRQKFGITSALLCFFFLVLGSFFLPDPRGLNPLPFSEDITVFFHPLRWHFFWFYLLLLATTGYAFSALAAVLGSFAKAVGKRHLGALRLAVLFLHCGFLVGLLAHLVAGTGNQMSRTFLIGPYPQSLGDHVVQLADLNRTFNRDGSLRTLTAHLRVDSHPAVLGYNHPVFIDLTSFVLLQGEGKGYALQLTNASETEYLFANAPWHDRLRLERIRAYPSLSEPLAALTDLHNGATSWYAAGMTLPGGTTLAAIIPYSGIRVDLRQQPALILMLLSGVLFGLGLVLYIPELVLRDHRNRVLPDEAPPQTGP